MPVSAATPAALRGEVPAGSRGAAALAKPGVGVGNERVEGGDEPVADREPRQHLAERPALERGHQEAERRRRQHHPGREAEQRIERQNARAPEEEQGDTAEPGREPGNDQPEERLGIQWRGRLVAPRTAILGSGRNAARGRRTDSTRGHRCPAAVRGRGRARDEQGADRRSQELVLPAVVYMADAVGTQTEALLIRGLSVGVTIRSVARRELLTGLWLGALVGLAFFPFVLAGWGDADVALAVAVALVASCSIATYLAIAVPVAA